MQPGSYEILGWDTDAQRRVAAIEVEHPGGTLRFPVASLVRDLALAVRNVPNHSRPRAAS
jgi:hypothetical protein